MLSHMGFDKDHSMKLKLVRGLTLLASLASVAFSTATATAQTNGWSTGFEATTTAANPVPYATGSLLAQDGWDLGGASRSPRVQTAAEIAAELTAAGLNAGQTVHSGDQALLVAKENANVESTGYFVRDIFPTPNTLEAEPKVTVNFWARPLTGGLGADPSGSPSGNEKTIGEREGNNFFGVADADDGPNGQRAAAVRFGVDAPAGTAPMYENVLERHIDYATNIPGVWMKSGLLWAPDQWYNFRFDLDYTTKTYDFYVNGSKVNAAPITFYHPAANEARRFFVSRGTNQAGSILDDVSVAPSGQPPLRPGDFDDNGIVDGNDFLVWQRDHSVGNLADWRANFGQGGIPPVGAVPEPATIMLAAAIALLGAGARRRPARASS
jgi:hypothetical protein